jgi:antitoxin component of RelBE/YafQ-DinJ toxin-antitoxin module
MAKKGAKLGRPFLPEDQTRNCTVSLRLQLEERATYEKIAKTKGLSLSEWIRQTLKSIIDNNGTLL